MSKIYMTAVKALRYGGRSWGKGSVFKVDERHVRVLTAGKLAVIYTQEPWPDPPMPSRVQLPVAEAKPVEVAPVEATADATVEESIPVFQTDPAPAAGEPEAKPKRTYQRRDMQAKQ